MSYQYYLQKFFPMYLITAIIVIFATLGADQAVTTMAEHTPIQRRHTIVIDAGHGGVDGGATSCTGVLESQLNLQIALRLDDLCHLLGYGTRMIRTTDVSVYTEGSTIAAKKVSDLRQRVRMVNETDNAILISIHQNIFADSQYDGAQVFYAPTDGSKELAAHLQTALIASVNPGSNRRCKPGDSIYLLQRVQYPGILLECGFLSNPEEEAKLRSPEYQKKLCCVIVSSLSRYIST